MTPMLPVRVTCVPPQADRSKSSISTSRSVPPRSGSLRSGNFRASSAPTKRIDTSWLRHTTRLASSSAFAMASGSRHAAQSMVDSSVPRWKLTCPHLEQAHERRRQHVLPGVLLHVIEPARPVHDPRHLHADVERRVQHMQDRPVGLAIDDVHHSPRPQRADVVRLAAGGGIEGGLVQHDEGTIFENTGLDDASLKRRQMAVGVIETVGHVDSASVVGGASAPQSEHRIESHRLRRSPWPGSRNCRSDRRGGRRHQDAAAVRES